MPDANQLPEPELGYIKTDKSNQPAFSARQMREAMLVCGAQNAQSDPQVPLSLTAAPQQAEVTNGIRSEDFTVDVVVKPMVGFAPVNTQGVRVTHNPTGISVTCDVARSQHTNRQQAFEKLSAILALRPAAVPMTDEQRQSAFLSAPTSSGGHRTAFMLGIQFAEAHHGIKPKEQA